MQEKMYLTIESWLLIWAVGTIAGFVGGGVTQYAEGYKLLDFAFTAMLVSSWTTVFIFFINSWRKKESTLKRLHIFPIVKVYVLIASFVLEAMILHVYDNGTFFIGLVITQWICGLLVLGDYFGVWEWN